MGTVSSSTDVCATGHVRMVVSRACLCQLTVWRNNFEALPGGSYLNSMRLARPNFEEGGNRYCVSGGPSGQVRPYVAVVALLVPYDDVPLVLRV